MVFFSRHHIHPCHPRQSPPTIQFDSNHCREYGYHEHMFKSFVPSIILRSTRYNSRCLGRSSHLSTRRYRPPGHQRCLRSTVRTLRWPKAGVGVYVFARASLFGIRVAVQLACVESLMWGRVFAVQCWEISCEDGSFVVGCAIGLLLGLLSRQRCVDGARAGDVGDVAEPCELSLAVVRNRVTVLLALLANLQWRTSREPLARSPGKGRRRCKS
jgi:hypothetical protein